MVQYGSIWFNMVQYGLIGMIYWDITGILINISVMGGRCLIISPFSAANIILRSSFTISKFPSFWMKTSVLLVKSGINTNFGGS